MVVFPKKRIIGLIGVPRSGKDTVANYLQETRNFATMAFADKIKEEFGISNADFEAAKIAGNIEDLRQKLWDFSAKKKASDPLYFIRKVMRNAIDSYDSVVITDIRTPDEMESFLRYDTDMYVRRIYFVQKTGLEIDADDKGCLLGTKLPFSLITPLQEEDKIRNIYNTNEGLFKFLCELEKFFFKEDIMDLPPAGVNDFKWRSLVSDYLSQFDVKRAI